LARVVVFGVAGKVGPTARRGVRVACVAVVACGYSVSRRFERKRVDAKRSARRKREGGGVAAVCASIAAASASARGEAKEPYSKIATEEIAKNEKSADS
jgi:hypothetical protein